jgi:hypothetical protein
MARVETREMVRNRSPRAPYCLKRVSLFFIFVKQKKYLFSNPAIGFLVAVKHLSKELGTRDNNGLSFALAHTGKLVLSSV